MATGIGKGEIEGALKGADVSMTGALVMTVNCPYFDRSSSISSVPLRLPTLNISLRSSLNLTCSISVWTLTLLPFSACDVFTISKINIVSFFSVSFLLMASPLMLVIFALTVLSDPTRSDSMLESRPSKSEINVSLSSGTSRLKSVIPLVIVSLNCV